MAGEIAIKLARFAIVIAIFALWELLSRTGIVNPRLLPSASDTLVTLGDLLQRANVRHDLVGDRAGSARRLRARRALRRAGRLSHRRTPLLRRRGQAAAVLRLQHSEVDLPADVHSGVRCRLFRRRSASASSPPSSSSSCRRRPRWNRSGSSICASRVPTAQRQLQTAFRVYLPSMLPVLLEALADIHDLQPDRRRSSRRCTPRATASGIRSRSGARIFK